MPELAGKWLGTGYFWKLLESDTEYVDLYKYIQTMYAKFGEWREDP